MNVQALKRRLPKVEASLATRAAHLGRQVRAQVIDSARDTADDSVADEERSEDLIEAELDAAVMRQGRDPIQRIDDGNVWRSVVDGEPIEVQRVETISCTPYCLKQERLLEAASRPKTPSL